MLLLGARGDASRRLGDCHAARERRLAKTEARNEEERMLLLGQEGIASRENSDPQE
jgi:hypothetical protein